MAALVDSGFPKASSGQANKTFLGCQNESPMEQVIEPEDNVDYSSISSPQALVSPDEDQYELLLKKLRSMMDESQGETLFEIGIALDGQDNGLAEEEMAASVATLQSLALALNADCVMLREKKFAKGSCRQYLVRRRADEKDFMEVRVAVVGNVDAGKSTLLGVLTHGELDNGRGFARQKLFRHKHEMESGRTSSVGNDILGFDSQGAVVNKSDHGSLDWVRICEKSSKVITFIDLAGHEKYLKTTVFGMTGHAPDFGMLMVGANAGVIGMTKEHLGLALALSVPVFVVVTKIDMCPPNVLQETMKLLVKILKSAGCRKVPIMVKSTDDVVMSATNFVSERLCPIFQVSNVTGENLDLLKMFLNLLMTRMPGNNNEPAEFQIDDTYSVPGVGTVVSGTTLKGTIRLNDVLLLGPDPLGHFRSITVKSIHRKRMPVREVRGGQTASFSLKKIKRSEIRKGMVMVSPAVNPQACWEFEGEILVLHHPTTISPRYQAMVHCGSIRQTASILSMTKDCLRTGDKATVRFRFIKHPEYIKAGQRLVFREGRTKAVGNIIKLCPHANPGSQQPRAKPNKMQKQMPVLQSVGEEENDSGEMEKKQSRSLRQHSSLAVGTKKGYKLFSLNSVDNIEQIYENESEDICIVERLFSSSLVAVVSLSSPRKLKVCHFKKGTEICNYSYSNTILAVRLNRMRLIVCLEESLYIHNIRDMKVLHTIRDTPPNPHGLCALSINSDNCYLAYPGSSHIGEVQVFDALNLQAKTMIPAHDSPLAAVNFNASGTKLATASEKGTVIRIFNIQDSTKLFEFRRGVKRCVTIYSLSFSSDSLFLCASSNTETVHIFKLETPKDSSGTGHSSAEESGGSGSWMDYFSRAVSVSASYLPSQVTEVFNQGRDFASVHLPFQGLRNICSLAVIQKMLRLLVASADGYLYVYNVDISSGGDCVLVKQHRLDGRPDMVGGMFGSPSKPADIPKSADSERTREIAAEVESPPKGHLRLDDEGEFPPMVQRTE
ncbi:unnamed protein product [Darwinula stevensoni]|uniref:GTP-binding protein 1 n=1 Tax=Darwinula stevensoni TaxID=69355 RepID=A0A7R9A168_9CRUS|nr:unnamed protein product [Darwinula stevensoni]CAG0885998.1 unnamed protein product [Darwinula stevensoni]